MQKDRNKLFLIDAMALIYRAHFAFINNPRITSKGSNTSAIFGFLNSLLEVIKNQKPTHIVVAFDRSEPTFRHEKFEYYKAHRDKQPEDITNAIPKVKEILQAFNIPIIEKIGYEADDIIGTISNQAKRKNLDIYMMTPDKDFGQLVDEGVFLYKPGYMNQKPAILDSNDILKKWNIERVNQITDILGLWGDASDNIPGIPNIGEKTAIKLIKEYKSIENLIKNQDKLKGKLKENVSKYSQDALLSKELATIHVNIKLDFSLDEAEYKGPNEAILRNILHELEFKTIEKRIFDSNHLAKKVIQTSIFGSGKDSSEQLYIKGENDSSKILNIDSIKHKYKFIDTTQERTSLIKILSKQKEITLDVETTNLNPHLANILGLSFSYKEKEAFYIKIPENKEETINLLREFNIIFKSKEILKIGHNLKNDIIILNNYGIKLEEPLFDTMIANYLVSHDTRNSLKVMAQNYLNYDLIDIETLMGKGEKKLSFNSIDINKFKEYAGENVDITLQIKKILSTKLTSENVESLFYKVEMPLVQVLSTIESNGVSIDIEILKDLSLMMKKELEKAEKEIYKLANATFNIASPKQLGNILFNKLKLLKDPQKTKSGQYATGESILSLLAKKHKIAAEILEFREFSKLKSTYVDALPNLINPTDGKIHTSYNQAIVATGRLSSTDPNLQNIPIRTDKGKKIRKAFIPSGKEFKIMSADYSQIELRIAASFAKDQHMINAFKQGEDIHRITASKVFQVKPSQVSEEMRRKAKMVNFGIIYGISPFGLSQRLDISRTEASSIIQSYFREFPDIKNYMDSIKVKAREDGFVTTILGRKRILMDINSRNKTLREFAERNAINSPIQGSNAEMIKVAMINIQKWILNNKLKSKMIMQVHDELIFDMHRDEEEIMSENIAHLMETAIPLNVPIKVNIKIGNNWLEAH